jgi:hypothetical protein
MAQAGMDSVWAISFCSQPLTSKGAFPMAKHRVGGKKAHVKKAKGGRRKGRHSKKHSMIKA